MKVVVPTYNARELVLRCVRSLLEDPAVAVVSVVDDVSDDGTVEALESFDPRVEVHRLSAKRGLSHAFNAGVGESAEDLVLFLNNDIMARPGAVSQLVAALQEQPHAVSAGGRLVDSGTGRTQMEYQPRAIPGAAGLLVRILGVERAWPRNPWTGQHLRRPLPVSGRHATDRQPAGACLLVRRSIFERVGGWDERFVMWYEDVDLSRRLAQHGLALYVPEAVFEHVGRASTRTWSKAMQHRYLYRGTLVYANRHLRTPGRLVAAAVAAACAARCAFHRVQGNRAATAVYRELVILAAHVVRGQLPSYES